MTHYPDIVFPEDVRFGSGTSQDDGSITVETRAGFHQTIEFTENPLSILRIEYVKNTTAARELYNILQVLRRGHTANAFNDSNHLSTLDQARDAIGTQTVIDQKLRNTADGSFVGDDATTDFDIIQGFPAGSVERLRHIVSPVEVILGGGETLQDKPDAFLAGVNGAAETFSFVSHPSQAAIRRVRFAAPPGAGLATTWGGRFYLPVRNVSAELAPELFVADHVTGAAGIALREALFPT